MARPRNYSKKTSLIRHKLKQIPSNLIYRCQHKTSSQCCFNNLNSRAILSCNLKLNSFQTQKDQNDYITSMIIINSGQKIANFYIKNNDNISTRVCKKGFLAILGIGKSRLNKLQTN